MKYDFLIVGSGLFGAVFAQQAKEKGKTCLVIDKNSHIAGNVYSEKREGIDVHIHGPHIFNTNKQEIWEYATRFAKFNQSGAPPATAVPGADRPAAAPAAPAQTRPLAPGMHRYTVDALKVTIDVRSAKIVAEPWGDSDMGTPAVHLRAKDSSFEVFLSSAANDRYDLAARARLEQSYQQKIGGVTSLRQEPTKDGGWEFEFRDNGNDDFGFQSRTILDGKPFNCAMSGNTRKQLDEVIDVCRSLALVR